MRVAFNLLTDHPVRPSGAYWTWTRLIPEMAKRLDLDEELYLLVSPKSRHYFQGYGPNVSYITYPSSNEHRTPRTLNRAPSGGGRIRVSVVQRNIRASHSGGHDLRLPGRDVRYHCHAGTAVGAAVLCDPEDPASIARAILIAIGSGRDRLRDGGFRRASQFTWGATAASTPEVYREVVELRRSRMAGGSSI
jgi:hypothetical protein